MSTQTGIRANEELNQFFAKCKDVESRSRYRMIKVVISNEELTLELSKETVGDWKQDWDKMVLRSIDNDEPCYLLYRLDDKDGDAFRWILISWSPDSSSVRNKMLYASTKASLKKEFGGGHIYDDLYGNIKEDISLLGYEKHLKHEESSREDMMTREEKEREEVKKSEASVEISVDSKQNHMSGLAFPLTDAAIESIKKFKSAGTDYVQLSIDLNKEIINVKNESTCTVQQLPSKVPEDEPRYHLFRFSHTHEGDFLNSTIFVFTMPGYNCSVKDRMLYASARNAVIGTIENFGLTFDKKVEVDSGKELTEQFFQDELHPKKSLNTAKFNRPAPPRGSGNRRMTKVPPSANTVPS